MAFFLGIASNVLANLIFWLLLGVTFWMVSRVVIRRFLRFFGLARVNRMGIYLSNLWNPQASLTGRTVGYTVTRGEDKVSTLSATLTRLSSRNAVIQNAGLQYFLPWDTRGRLVGCDRISDSKLETSGRRIRRQRFRSMPRLPEDRETPRRLQGANQTQHWRPADYYKRC